MPDPNIDNQVKFTTSPGGMSQDEFLTTFGGVYEHSRWVAEKVWQQGLEVIHDKVSAMAQTMSSIVESEPERVKLDLIRAHPDLAGKVAQVGGLTEDSSNEQATAGIDQCTPEEFARFQKFNKAYREKFKFPFIMAVKNSNRHEILRAFEQRLCNPYNVEYKRAMEEIHKIALFRLYAISQ